MIFHFHFKHVVLGCLRKQLEGGMTPNDGGLDLIMTCSSGLFLCINSFCNSYI